MQCNVKGDWGSGYKKNYGLEKGTIPSVEQSINAGVNMLATKGFKGGVTYDSKSGAQTFTFQGWDSATSNYNGGGVSDYGTKVSEMVTSSIPPTSEDY